MKEIWRDIKGFEGKYQISNNNGWKNLKRNSYPKGRINNGYRSVGLGKGNEIFYHILVAKAFPEICGEWYEGCSVHHKDFDKLNNKPENLIILSPSEHSKIHYQYQNEKFTKPSLERSKSISKALKGRRNECKHIPIIQFSVDGKQIKEYECISDVTADGYNAGNVCACCKGKLKTSSGYIWKYKKAV